MQHTWESYQGNWKYVIRKFYKNKLKQMVLHHLKQVKAIVVIKEKLVCLLENI
jgi:hypothetical protein